MTFLRALALHRIGSVLLMVLLALSGWEAVAASGGAKAGSAAAGNSADLERLRQLGKDAHYQEAEALARKLLERADASGESESLFGAEVRALLADTLVRLGRAKDPEPLDLAERALQIREREAGEQSTEAASSHMLFSLIYNVRVESGKAQAAAEKALEIMEMQDAPDPDVFGKILSSLGYSLWRQASHAEARTHYQRALKILEASPGDRRSGIANVLSQLGFIEAEVGNSSDAVELLERALAIRREALPAGHPDILGNISNIALMKSNAGDYEGAVRLYGETLVATERTLGAEHPTTATILNNLGTVYQRTGELETAGSYYGRALAIRLKVLGKEDYFTGWSYLNLGSILNLSGRYLEAGRHYEDAGKAFLSSVGPDHPAYASNLRGQGTVQMELGELDQASESFEQALAIQRRVYGDRSPAVAFSLHNLASVRIRAGRPHEAVELLEESLSIHREVSGEDLISISTIMLTLGQAFLESEKPARALAIIKEAVAIEQDTAPDDSYFHAKALGDLAAAHFHLGDYLESAKILHLAVSAWEKGGNSFHPELSRSLTLLARSLLALDREREAVRAALKGERMGLENFHQLAPALTHVSALRFEEQRSRGLDTALSIAARVSRGDENADLLEEVYDTLIRARAVVLDEIAARTRLLGLEQDEETAHLAKALRTASMKLSKLAYRGPEGEDPETFKKTLDAAKEERAQAEIRLSMASEGVRSQQARRKVGLEEIRSALPPGSALVAYSRYVELNPAGKTESLLVRTPSYLAIVLTGDKEPLSLVRIGSAEKIDLLVAEWQREASLPDAVLSTEVPQSYLRAAGALREAIWDPVAGKIGDRVQVFIVPDGAINLVSFAALPSDETGFLVESDIVLHYLSSERDLVRTPGHERRGRGLIAIGGPSFDAPPRKVASMSLLPAGPVVTVMGGGPEQGAYLHRRSRSECGDLNTVRFDPLPASGAEVMEIESLWSEARKSDPSLGEALSLTGARAGEHLFKLAAPGSRVLHLATHGFFHQDACPSATSPVARESARGKATENSILPLVSENPLLLSGLALAGANRRKEIPQEEAADDGILTAEEISALDLEGVEWAVLSACETGVGKVQAGEGVLGLRRAFQTAGARTLIMSLWAVDDTATRGWMNELYRGRLQGLSTRDSVRQASLSVLQERRRKGLSPHPFYWGGFIAAGDWR